MGNKKLDKLFQERFRDYGETPDEKVWHAIETSLDKKKRHRIIPIWWKLAGVAAILVIAFVALDPLTNLNGEDGVITDIEKNDTQPPAKNVDGIVTEDINAGVVVEADSQKADGDSKNDGLNDKIDASVATSNTVGTAAKEKSKSDQNNNGVRISSPSIKLQPQLTDSDAKEGNGNSAADKLKKNALAASDKASETVIENGTDVGSQAKKAKGGVNEPIIQALAVQENEPRISEAVEEAAMAKVREQDIPDKSEQAVAQVDEKKETEAQSVADKKKSIFDAIKEDEEAVAIVEHPKNRWSAGANVAPVYFDAFGEGSPVHSIFVPNAKSGETNLSYGLSVAYEINSKLSIRSGLSKVDYGYGTQDIEYTSSPISSTNEQIENINYANTSRSIILQSKNSPTFSLGSKDQSALAASDATGKNPARDGSMTQQFGYLEVPLELNYAILDRKIGLNVIGGFSSLFLVDNSISLSTGEQTLEMGEANNVNDINFSANFGFGVDYKISRTIKLNVEPIFKYQLNTFSNVDGTFQPFSVGVYSGLKFKF